MSIYYITQLFIISSLSKPCLDVYTRFKNYVKLVLIRSCYKKVSLGNHLVELQLCHQHILSPNEVGGI